ncbi:hypothetical protein [Tenacibaculum sp. M341]|uniref:hypothetical protein n=1 Tax=Tenacibaculum sp. M341 TaxID=2530339 RepID=UPI00104EB820|nr:hypothetical protein [Tenacibaculum sp. M341]TCI84401.1 hypothetical protein EYW44_21555 [Tenacibaculum sp. M341]
MKKNFIISAVTVCMLIFSSCSSDEDNNTSNSNDPILGKWFYFSLNNEEVSDCEKMTSIEFAVSGATTTETFEILTDDSCGRSSLTENTWTNKGDNIYTFNNLESKIEFFDNGNSFKISSGNIVYKKMQ